MRTGGAGSASYGIIYTVCLNFFLYMLHKRIHLTRGIQANALRTVAPWSGMYAVLMNHGLTTHSILLYIAKCHHSNNLQLWPLGATYCNNTWGASSEFNRYVIFLLHFRKTKYNDRSQKTFLWWKISCSVKDRKSVV